MSGEIVTAAQILAGTGAAGWTASRLLGASADAVGEHIQAFLGSRVSTIFAKVHDKATENDIEPVAIQPGLLTRMVIDASMSQDEEDLTDWWANLFLSAGSGHTEANRHAVFSDVLSTLGPNEVVLLADFVSQFREAQRARGDQNGPVSRSEALLMTDQHLEEVFDMSGGHGSNYQAAKEALVALRLPVPLRIYEWKLPDVGGDEGDWRYEQAGWYKDRQFEVEILERSRIFVRSRHHAPVLTDRDSWVGTVRLTELGVSFYESCTRETLGS